MIFCSFSVLRDVLWTQRRNAQTGKQHSLLLYVSISRVAYILSRPSDRSDSINILFNLKCYSLKNQVV